MDATGVIGPAHSLKARGADGRQKIFISLQKTVYFIQPPEIISFSPATGKNALRAAASEAARAPRVKRETKPLEKVWIFEGRPAPPPPFFRPRSPFFPG